MRYWHTAFGHELRSSSLRLLFIPVSAPRGTGEYARALAIASEAKRRRPDDEIHFVVSRDAPYAQSVPFPATILSSSPTFHPREVARLISELKPEVVVLDNAGRTSQLRAARAAGARIVFVSSRDRQRRRAFRMRWMRLIDEHWIALPELIAGPHTFIERMKLRMLGRPRVRYLDTLLPRETDDVAAQTPEKYGVRANEFVLVVPGGGVGHRRMSHAPQTIARAALRIASHGHATLLVGVRPGSDAEPIPATLRLLPLLPPAELMALIRRARLVVVNGADTLLQVFACGRPCVAVPMAPDQVRRLVRLARAGVHAGVPLEAEAIENRTVQLLDDERASRMLVERIAALRIEDAMDTVQGAICELATRDYK